MTSKPDGSRFALITGATGGIGREICRMAAKAGYNVIVHYRSDKRQASNILREVEACGVQAELVYGDLSNPVELQSVSQSVTELIRAHGSKASLGLLVNNAARLLGPSFQEATMDEFDHYFAVNTRAPFFLSQYLLPVMSPGSSIVNISSANAHFSSPGDIVYSMTKSAVESLTKNMAEAIAPQGVRVNAIVPGFTDNGHPAFGNDRVRDYMSSYAVLGGISSPAHVASAVMFLASDAAARTTGAILDVSGGSLLAARGTREHSVSDLLSQGG